MTVCHHGSSGSTFTSPRLINITGRHRAGCEMSAGRIAAPYALILVLDQSEFPGLQLTQSTRCALLRPCVKPAVTGP